MQGKILRLFDRYFGSFLYIVCWYFLPFLEKKSGSQNVLVIKMWAIGESILVLPSIKALAEKGYEITVMCTKQNLPVFEEQDFIKNIVVFDYKNPIKAFLSLMSLRSMGFSASIDSEPYMRFSAIVGAFCGANTRIGFENRKLLYTNVAKIDENEHAVMSFCRLFSGFSEIPAPARLVQIHSKPFNVNIKRRSVALHAGSASTSTSRRLSEEKFAEAADYFSSKGWQVFLVGSASEKEINSKIVSLCKKAPQDLSGRLDIKELAFLFSRMNLVIANDSGPMHIAACMGTPTIGLFGPNLPERFGPYGKKCIGIRKDTGPACIRPFRSRFPQCNHKHMESIELEDIVVASKRILRS